ADPGAGAENGANLGLYGEAPTGRVSPGLRRENAPDSPRPGETSECSVRESLPDHLAYARAEEKISAETFSQHMNQVRADALVAMVEHFLVSGPDYRGLQGLQGAERCQVLSCDASLVTVLEDDAGKVLNVGRKSRIVPEHIRRALRERDGVCQYPGCQESEYVDAHHIQHWAEGGETRLDNLVTLCRFHHRQLHRGCPDVRLNGVSAEIFSPRELSCGSPKMT
ncbi:HNH endonuclease signature motif containing protein, partial [Haliea sp. E1-2-M8]|uniref:HNH endonuclease signature motif containing protein n=1 Tax=Haliea sp. E1-2-M8 TaxID=3064706 RepID=UPI00271E8913